MKCAIIALILLVSLQHNVPANIIREDENRIPFYALLTENLTLPDQDKVLKAGLRFVVIRPVGEEMVLGNFSRLGTYKVPIGITDIPESVIEARSRAGGKVVPRMAYFLANRIVPGEGGWQHAMRSDDVNKFERWILIYGDSSDALTIQAIESASEAYAEMPDEARSKLCVVYIDITGDKTGIQKIADTLNPAIQAMPGYLAKGYCKSFQHIAAEDKMPLLVEVESSGRIVRKISGLDKMNPFLAKIN